MAIAKSIPVDKESHRQIKKLIGKLDKVEYTNDEWRALIDAGEYEIIYKSFAAFLYKIANSITYNDSYKQSYFQDLISEGLVGVGIAIERYKEMPEHPNFAGYCMIFARNHLLTFNRQYLSGQGLVKQRHSTNPFKKPIVPASSYFFTEYQYDHIEENMAFEEYYNELDKFDEVFDYVTNNYEKLEFNEMNKKVFETYYSIKNNKIVTSKDACRILEIDERELRGNLTMIKRRLRKNNIKNEILDIL